MAVVASTIRAEHMRALWKGNSANVIRIVPNKGILFLSNERIVALMSPADGQPLSDARRLAAGSLSGIVQLTLTYPLDITQTRLAAGTKYRSIVHCIRETYAQGGVRGLYAGYVASCVGVAPYTGAQFLTYHKVTGYFRSRPGASGEVTTMQKLFAGAVSGFVAQSVSYPLDTVRRRMHMQGTLQKPLYSGGWDCFRQLVATEGVRGLYRGAWINALRAGPSQAIQFAVYSKMKELLKV